MESKLINTEILVVKYKIAQLTSFFDRNPLGQILRLGQDRYCTGQTVRVAQVVTQLLLERQRLVNQMRKQMLILGDVGDIHAKLLDAQLHQAANELELDEWIVNA